MGAPTPTAKAARAAIEAQAGTLLADSADFQRLKTVPGIGAVIALVILAEAGDQRRFGHHRQFLKFCGLDLAKCQSGAFRSREKLSKRGNARLRCALWMAAMSAARMRENAFRDKYRRYIASAPVTLRHKRARDFRHIGASKIGPNRYPYRPQACVF